jgi:tripartite-type tricarboxylate transporter receptor subunit TctC
MRVWSSLISPVLLVAAVALASGAIRAQPTDYFSGKTITIYVSNPPGGGYDLNARIVAQHLPDHIPGHPAVVVSNMVGAGGIRGANFIYNVAPRDGTALGAEIQNFVQYQVEGIEGVNYDASRFSWIGSTTPSHELLYAWHTVPIATIADLKNRETVLATFGPVETIARMLTKYAGARFKLVKGYTGVNEANLALERGEVEATLSSLPVLHAYRPEWLKNKLIKIFFYQGFERNPEIPDVPASIELAKTAADRKVIGFFANGSNIGRLFVAPPGVPADILATLRNGFAATMKDQSFLADCAQRKIEVEPKSGAELQKIVDQMLDLDANTRAQVRDIAGNEM